MIYTGFSDSEIKKIVEILDRNKVNYEIMVADPEAARKPTRAMENLVHIKIEQEEFDKISVNDTHKLFDLRVYREEESPFTEEELASPAEPKPYVKTVDPDAKFKTVTTILAVVGVILLALWRKGMFK